MGLDFIRDTKKQFDQKRDRSREKELEDENLLTFAIADNDVEIFRCRLTDLDSAIIPGYQLVLRAHSEEHVEVSQSGKVIGVMPEDEAKRLTHLMKKGKVHTGIVTMLAFSEADISGEFKIKSKRPFKK